MIVIIDDDEGVRTSLSYYLKSCATEIKNFADGNSALKFSENNKVDLIITDILMPDMDGIEIIRKIKEISPTTIIYAMSGGATEYLRAAEMLGAAWSFVKDRDGIHELRDRVKNIFFID